MAAVTLRSTGLAQLITELYYLACADHLSWGYVDQSPLIAGVAWLVAHVFGASLFGLRLVHAVAAVPRWSG